MNKLTPVMNAVAPNMKTVAQMMETVTYSSLPFFSYIFVDGDVISYINVGLLGKCFFAMFY
jgi:hypothetical protein